MKNHTVSAIALSNRDFPSFEAKLEEAVGWIETAAAQGSELAVLPETLGIYAGDGPDNPNALAFEQTVTRDWKKETEILFDCARRCRIAVTVPLFIEEDGRVLNVFYLVSNQGEVLGRYVKNYPTRGELDQGVKPGGVELINWEGLKIGGGICYDMGFPELFDAQKAAGANLILCPSLTPGGRYVQHYALTLQIPFVIAYPAWSCIVDTNGSEVVAGGYREETLRFGFGAPVYTATINFDKATFHYDRNQAEVAAMLAKRGDKIRIEMLQDECVFIAESIAVDYTLADLIKEFDLETIDEHYAQYQARREKVLPEHDCTN